MNKNSGWLLHYIFLQIWICMCMHLCNLFRNHSKLSGLLVFDRFVALLYVHNIRGGCGTVAPFWLEGHRILIQGTASFQNARGKAEYKGFLPNPCKANEPLCTWVAFFLFCICRRHKALLFSQIFRPFSILPPLIATIQMDFLWPLCVYFSICGVPIQEKQQNPSFSPILGYILLF